MKIVLDTNIYIAVALQGEIECALAGKADSIVTADQDLIKLKSYKGIGIIHPKTLSWTFPEYFKK